MQGCFLKETGCTRTQVPAAADTRSRDCPVVGRADPVAGHTAATAAVQPAALPFERRLWACGAAALAHAPRTCGANNVWWRWANHKQHVCIGSDAIMRCDHHQNWRCRSECHLDCAALHTRCHCHILHFDASAAIRHIRCNLDTGDMKAHCHIIRCRVQTKRRVKCTLTHSQSCICE